MTYGLEVRNAAGDLVLDSTKTWKFMDVISKTTGSSVTGYNASTDLVLVSFPNTDNKTYASTVSGTTLSFKEGVSTGSGTSVSLNYVHLRTVNNQTTDSSTYGLEVYGPDGTLVFDSARLKNIGKMEPQRLYQAGTLTGGSQIIGIAGQTIGGRRDYVSIDVTVPYPSSANGSFFYYEVKNDGKMYFNSYRRTTLGNTFRDNPCDIIVYEDILPSIIAAQLPPGSDGNIV